MAVSQHTFKQCENPARVVGCEAARVLRPHDTRSEARNPKDRVAGLSSSGSEMLPLPYRGRFGDPRPAELAGLALPPAAMRSRRGLRPLKAWRYVGVFGPELMICLAAVRVGPARQWFWAVWDRGRGRLDEHTVRRSGEVELGYGWAAIRTPRLTAELGFTETDGIETISPAGDGGGYAWTRKQGGLPVSGQVTMAGHAARPISGHAIVDDSAGYHARHVQWRWCAGVGTSPDGRAVAWNLADGIHDDAAASERTVWIDGQPHQPAPAAIADDLGRAGELRFAPEAERRRDENRLLVRSRYRQPFGTFSGTLPGGTSLAQGWGVMEDHDVHW